MSGVALFPYDDLVTFLGYVTQRKVKVTKGEK